MHYHENRLSNTLLFPSVFVYMYILLYGRHGPLCTSCLMYDFIWVRGDVSNSKSNWGAGNKMS